MARPVRFNINAKEADINDNIALREMPEGLAGEGYFATSLEKVIGMGRQFSMWPVPFATSCCGIEYMATVASNYDIGRFGGERMAHAPHQCDVLMVMGTISKKMAPIIKRVYAQMAEPRWVMAIGACACSGGIFDTYSVLQGIDQIVPVDVYVSGCPPRPEAIIEGFMLIQELNRNESLRRRNSEHYKALLGTYGIE